MLKEKTKDLQSRLAGYCRTGELTLTNEVNRKHVHHYRRLVYNIIDDILETAFPIFFDFVTEDVWKEMVHDFFSHHNCSTPQVWKVPGEFYEYACQQNWKEKYQLPFLEELLLFEWIEMDIHTMKDEVFPEHKIDGDWHADVIALNPEYRILSTEWPVHTTAPSNLTPELKGRYFILIFRQPETGNVQFLDISVLYALTIEKIEEGKTLQVILDELQAMFGFPDKREAEKHLIQFFGDLQKKGFMLGFRK